jgi:serine protease Do
MRGLRGSVGLLMVATAAFADAGRLSAALPGPPNEVIERTLSKVVKIFGAGGLRNLEAYGSGFLVSPQGHVVTVWNHVLDNGEVSVVLSNGRRYTAKLVNGEPQLDLAVLKIEGEERDLPYFDLGQAADVPPGTRVLGFSNMFKVATGDEPVSVVHGIVAVRSRLSSRRGAFTTTYDRPVYVLDAVTNNPGAAGGALTTLDGRLVGMIGREVRNAQSNTWVNYAVPITDLRKAISDIVAARFSPAPSRGPDQSQPRYAVNDLGLVMVPDVVYRTPAYVESVLPGSAAAEAGIAAEDLVVLINDELVPSHRALAAIVGRLEAGDLVRLVVRRKDNLVSLELRVPDRKRK